MSRPTRIAVTVCGGRAVLTALDHGAVLSPRLVDTDGRTVTVALVASSATLLAGDVVEIEVDVGAGACLELIEPSGTVAYNGRGGSARWHAHARVASGARLIWTAAPLVIAEGADLLRTVCVDMSAGGLAAVHDLLVLGRSGERAGGALRSLTDIRHDGRPLLREDLDLRDTAWSRGPAVLGGRRVVATAFLLGRHPDEAASRHETLLAGPGAWARTLGRHAHEAMAGLSPVWERWRAGVLLGDGGKVGES